MLIAGRPDWAGVIYRSPELEGESAMSQVTSGGVLRRAEGTVCASCSATTGTLATGSNATTIAESAERLNAVMAARLAVGTGDARCSTSACGVGRFSLPSSRRKTGAQVGRHQQQPARIGGGPRDFAKAQHLDHLGHLRLRRDAAHPVFPNASFDRVWSLRGRFHKRRGPRFRWYPSWRARGCGRGGAAWCSAILFFC